MTTPLERRRSVRRVLAMAAAALALGACAEVSTAPGGGGPRASDSHVAKQPVKAEVARGRRGGYNVVAD
jgi:hypothetical protein